VDCDVPKTPKMLPIEVDKVLQPRVHQLYGKPCTAIDPHLMLLAVGSEAPVHPEDILIPPLVPRVRNDGLCTATCDPRS